MTILQTDPRTEVVLKNTRTGEHIEAKADACGIIRDSEGRCFSQGEYKIHYERQ